MTLVPIFWSSPLALQAEHAKREKARKAAGAAKPLWNEDGERRGILDKYDEQVHLAVCYIAHVSEHSRLAALLCPCDCCTSGQLLSPWGAGTASAEASGTSCI